jgi:pimeloyl-ACP methyl ester carboxylesterase
MPVGKPLEDLVVVVPGILGSRLARIDSAGGYREIWGTSAATLSKNLLTFGRRIKQLAISSDADPDEPGDGIAPIGLISDFQVIPGFLSIAGYDGLMARLRRDNSLRDDQVVGFAYDWRLSNRVAGRKLASFLDQQVTSWRMTSGHSAARAVLVCHSMGGLVARWCTEREHGHELVSRTITVGTPYKGAAMALDALVNGVQLPRRIGPHFDELIRSLPSVRELLPTYACVRTSTGPLKHLDEIDILPAAWVAAALEFHGQLSAAAAMADRSRTNTLDAFRGGLQPTLTTASLNADRVLTAHESSDGTTDGRDDRGDGTVPRDSATPPEWTNPSWAKAVAQRHASMHLAASVGNELAVMLSDAPRLMSGRQQIGLRVPGPVPAGQTVVITIDGPPGLGLMAVVSPLDGSAEPARKAAKREDGRYLVRMGELPPGLHHVQIVRSSPTSAPVEEISDTILLYTES